MCQVNTSVDTGADKITYEQYDSYGEANIVNNEATDYRDAEITKKQFSNDVRTIGNAVRWTMQDIRRWAMAARGGLTSSGRSFTQRKTDGAIKQIRQREESIVAQGDSAANLVGFYNNTNLISVTLATDGTGTSSAWDTKTVDQITRDFNLLVNMPQVTTNSTFTVDTVILDSKNYTLIATKRLGANNDSTVLEFLLKAHKEKNLKVHAYDRVNLGVASGMTRAIAYQRSPNVLTQEIPQPIEILPPEREGASFKTILRERHGGVQIYYPKACARATFTANT